jgi:putative heme-binding domain-containing protein
MTPRTLGAVLGLAALSAAAKHPADRLVPDPPPPPVRELTGLGGGPLRWLPDEVVVFVGPENLVLEQRHGSLEARLTAHALAQGGSPRFRHFSWEGDTVHRQNRMMNWGSWEENLRGVGATLVVTWFGQVEALDDTRDAAAFARAYAALLDTFARVTPRGVVIGPAPFERPGDPRLPDLTARNSRVREHHELARRLAAERGLAFVDLFTPLSAPDTPRVLTRNGLHFHAEGLEHVGALIATALEAEASVSPGLRAAVVEKNRLWFDTWRCMNWAFAYGDRDTQPFVRAAGAHPSFVEELRQFQPLLNHAEAVIQAVAAGRPPPAPPPPPPPRADPPALSAAEQRARFKLREGFAVDLFADESLGVVRPLQIRWDARGRLWIACTPSYPQLLPGEHAQDYLLVVEDTDGDGRADRAHRFAEHLTLPMGFTFAPREAGGGVYLCESTQLLHLPDADGDDQADGRTVILSGFGTGDSHQNANSLRWGPDGLLWFTQGYHIWSYVETPHGIAELNRSGVWRFNPRTLRLDGFLNESAAGLNGWGTAWDDHGQIFHGSGADTHLWHTTPALVPTLHARPLPTKLAGSRGKSMEPEFLGSSHLPDELRGALLKSTYFTSQVQLYRLRDQGSSFASEDLGDLLSGGQEFRPVETRVGPDGALYVCDWFNPVIGHYQASYRDPRRDRSHGRLWRVSAVGRPTLARPRLDRASATELAQALRSPERWVRDHARRELFLRPAGEALPAASAALPAPGMPGEMPLLYELSGVFAAHESPQPALVDRLAAAEDFRYRAWAARLVGLWAEALPDALARLRGAVEDRHPRVRLEAVVACASQPAHRGAEAMALATRALDHPLDPGLEHALTLCIHALQRHWQPALRAGRLDFGGRPHALARVLTTAGGANLLAAVRTLIDEPALTSAAREELLAVLAGRGSPADAAWAVARAESSLLVLDAVVQAAGRAPTADYAEVMARLVASPHPAAHRAALRLVVSSGRDHGAAALVGQWAGDATADSALRGEALHALARLRGAEALPVLRPLFTSPDLALRTAALAAGAALDPAAVAAAAAQSLAEATTPDEAGALLRPLLGRVEGPAALAEALRNAPPTAAAAERALLWLATTGQEQPDVREALRAAVGASATLPAYSPETVRELLLAARAGDARRGEGYFRNPALACLACHRVGSEGGTLGPDLTAIGRAMTPEMIVESVYWPRRQVKEGYLLTQVETRDGRVWQGYKASETAAELGLRDLAGQPLPPLPKSEITRRTDTGTLMPDGLLAPLDPAARHDLLRYLLDLGRN